MSNLIDNAAVLEREFNWLSEIIDARLTRHFRPDTSAPDVYDLPPPTYSAVTGPYLECLSELEGKVHLEAPEVFTRAQALVAHRLVLLLALAPHIAPAVLDVFFARNKNTDRRYTEFGGVSRGRRSGFLPTGETALFLLAGSDLSKRLWFSNILARAETVYLTDQPPGAPLMGGRLCIYPEYLAKFTTGEPPLVVSALKLPMKELSTPLEWEDLALDSLLLSQVKLLSTWLEHEPMIMKDWGMDQLLQPGYRALFYGAPGTGKTLTATLIGKSVNRPVYRFHLSHLIDKYIGETEKNLANLFKAAEAQRWILFFDEADALFGKRTEVKDANLQSTNPEISAFLQNIEDFSGMVILSINDLSKIDKAFARRFQSILHFPNPDYLQRQQLWQSAFGDKVTLSEDIDLARIARHYELTGAEILNVAQFCVLKAAQRAAKGKNPNREIDERDLLNGIRQEFEKSNKL